MAVGWLTVLQLVPWSDVIKNAPKVADGAKKLWNAAGKKPQPPPEDADTGIQLSSEGQAIAALQTHVLALETATQNLHEQMLASTELIKALAEQNTQLIRRAEINRVRLQWLAGFTTVVSVVSAIALTLVMTR